MKQQHNMKADVVAIVESVGRLISNPGSPHLDYCDLLVTDDSETELSLTVWGEIARSALQRFNAYPVVGFYPVRVKHYQNCNLSTVGQVIDFPNTPRTQQRPDGDLQGVQKTLRRRRVLQGAFGPPGNATL